MFLVLVLISFSAFIISFALFHPSVRLANIIGAIDFPSERKVHSSPTARLGGLCFFASFSILLSILPIDRAFKLSLLTGGTVIFAVGFLDDALSISPFAKLSGQFLSSTFFIFFTFDQGGSVYYKIFGVISLFWLIFITNATNLCDGLDGLAGGITSAQALCLSVIALIFKSYDIFLCSVILLFAIIGFIPRNIPPAKAFMGDCGSLFLGFILSALSIRLIYEAQSIISLIAIPLLFRVPTADAIQSFIRRIIKRKNPFSADRGHFHHKLLDLGFTQECAALALISISLFFGMIAILICLI